VDVTKWEYAWFYWLGSARWVKSTSGLNLQKLDRDSYIETLRQLGDDGWELFAVSDGNHYFKRPARA